MSLRANLITAASNLLASHTSDAAAGLKIIIKGAGVVLVVKASAAEMADFGPQAHLTPMEEAIVQVLEEGTMRGKQLAERAGGSSRPTARQVGRPMQGFALG